MTIFDSVEYERFFNPLCCRNKRIYYECIWKLIEKSKFVPVLYETDARDCIILYLRNCTYALQEEIPDSMTELISSNKSESENAGAILRYFRHCGWISDRELGRNGDNIATVSPYCRKMMSAIEKIFNRDTSGALTNHIFAIYDILKSVFQEDNGRTVRPYSNILVPLEDNVADLKNELLILKDSIRSIMKIVIKMTELNAFGQFLIKDEMMKRFFNDYFFVKKDGLIPGYMYEIETYLKRLVSTDIYQNMIGEYQTLNQVNEHEARETIDKILSEIQQFVDYEYINEMDYIDKKINNYYNLYTTRILMVLSNNTNMQSYLNELLMLLREFNKEEKEEVLNSIAQCHRMQSYRYIGRKSIERRKKRKPNPKRGAITISTLSEEEKEKLTQELLRDNQDRYSVYNADEYFNRLVGEQSAVELTKQMIHNREDALMIASSIIYSGSSEFGYEVEFLDGIIETDIANISHIRIKRKSK